MKAFCNPADEFMKILSINYPKGPADEAKITKLVQAYENSKPQILEEMKEMKIGADFLADAKIYQAPFCF